MFKGVNMEDTEIEQWIGLKQGGDTYSNYMVSSLGRVFNIKSGNFVSHVIAGEPQYYYVNLINDEGNRKLRRVHNIMGWSFLGDMPNKGDTIDHIDRNKYNNGLYNLRWLDMSGQIYNRDFSPDGNEAIRKMLLEIYDKETPIHVYLYRVMTSQQMSLGDAMYQWSSYIKPDIKIKELMYTPSVEISGVWYPNKSIVSKLHGISLPKVKEGVRNKLSIDEIKTSEYDPSECSRFSMDGFWMTKVEHCERLYISHQRVINQISKYGYSFEEAVKIPIERKTHYCINGVVMNTKTIYLKYGLHPKRSNSYLNKSGTDRNLRDTLEYYGVDTSDMEIYFCDGKDIVMYDKPV